jgi:hypothetical protein
MIVRQTPSQLILKDSPGMHWVLGGMFLCIGGLAVAGALGLFANAQELSPLARAVIVGFGSAGIGAGVWVLRRSPGSICVFDRTQGHLVVRRRGFSGASSSRHPLFEIGKAEVAEGRDIDGDPVYRLQVALRSGQALPLSKLWAHGKGEHEAGADAVRNFLRSPGVKS